MATAVKQRDDLPALRPLKVLVPLIKNKLAEAEEAADAATRPYWQQIGDLLAEAKVQFERVSEFDAWAKRNFGFGRHQSGRYLSLSRATTERRGQPRGNTLSEALRSVGQSPRGHHGYQPREQNPNDWRPQIDDIADRARRDADRIRDEELTRVQEREAQRTLALRLIDIGYKVLAKELHPDAGGSKDAMARLHIVRDRLKSHA